MNAFNGRLISALSPDRLYRVIFEQDDVFFIQVAGQSFGQAIAAQFGALGMLIYAPIQRRAKAKLEARMKDLDTQPARTLLAAGKNNFSAAVADFESSTLQAAPVLGGHGPHLGRWVVQIRGRKQMTVQLETQEDMLRALATLPRSIARHANQVAWDSAKSKFSKIA
jgi:hypothetical protein